MREVNASSLALSITKSSSQQVNGSVSGSIFARRSLVLLPLDYEESARRKVNYWKLSWVRIPRFARRKFYENLALTGVFFEQQTVSSLSEAIVSFESCEEIFLPQQIQLHARKFDTSIFVNRLRKYIDGVIKTPVNSLNPKEKDGIG